MQGGVSVCEAGTRRVAEIKSIRIYWKRYYVLYAFNWKNIWNPVRYRWSVYKKDPAVFQLFQGEPPEKE